MAQLYDELSPPLIRPPRAGLITVRRLSALNDEEAVAIAHAVVSRPAVVAGSKGATPTMRKGKPCPAVEEARLKSGLRPPMRRSTGSSGTIRVSAGLLLTSPKSARPERTQPCPHQSDPRGLGPGRTRLAGLIRVGPPLLSSAAGPRERRRSATGLS